MFKLKSIFVNNKFLPANKTDWKSFIRLSFFSLIQTLLFSINGFIDNFMVGNIFHQGMIVENQVLTSEMAKNLNEASIAGLGAAGQWWFILTSITTYFISAIGFFTSQYFGKGDLIKTQKSHTTKFQLAAFVVLPIAILVIILPEQFIAAWTHYPLDSSHTIVTQQANGVDIFNKSYTNYLGAQYIRVAAFSWIIWVCIVPLNNSLRDVGKPQGGAIAIASTLVTHISLNFVFIYNTNLGLEGPAIALLISRFINLTVTLIYIEVNKLPIKFFTNPFIWDKDIYRKWISRWQYLVYAVVWTLAIGARSYLWALFFQGQDGSGVSALTVLGIAGAIQNIFLVAFDGLQPLFAKYVSGNMGRGEFDKAKDYSKRIIGYGLLCSFIVSIILISIAFAAPSMTMIFNVNSNVLIQVKYCIFVVSGVYFSWIILASIRTIMSSGGKPGTISLIDGIAICLQSIWILCIGLMHKHLGVFGNFALAYFVFFVTDIIKLPFFIYPFVKLEWTKNLTT